MLKKYKKKYIIGKSNITAILLVKNLSLIKNTSREKRMTNLKARFWGFFIYDILWKSKSVNWSYV